MLNESNGNGLLGYRNRSRQQRQAESSAFAGLDVLIGTLTPLVAYKDSVDYRGRGYGIGSGMMESTCKQIVGRYGPVSTNTNAATSPSSVPVMKSAHGG